MVDLLAGFKGVARAEFDAEVATLTSFIYDENVGITKLEAFGLQNWYAAWFRGLPWPNWPRRERSGAGLAESSVCLYGYIAHGEGAPFLVFLV